MAHLPTLFIKNHDESIALLHGISHTFAQAAIVLVRNFELIYYHLDVVILLAIEAHAVSHLHNLAIDTHIEKSFTSHLLEEFTIVSLTRLN